jgi:hypothetical protein
LGSTANIASSQDSARQIAAEHTSPEPQSEVVAHGLLQPTNHIVASPHKKAIPLRLIIFILLGTGLSDILNWVPQNLVLHSAFVVPTRAALGHRAPAGEL